MKIFLVTMIIFLFLIMYYLVTRLEKFSFMQKINSKLIRLILSLLPIILIIIIFNYVNALVIFIHLTFFFFLFELIFKILIKKKLSYYLEGILAIILTTIYLSIGAYLDYHVFETHYEIETPKDIQDNFRIIQISDSHIGTTFDGNGFRKHIEKISNIQCDLVVITGDYVDDDTKYEDMLIATKSFKLLKPKYGIYFVYGNHDKGYFNYRDFNNNDLKKALMENDIKILEDESVDLGNNIILIGRKDKSEKERKSIQELTQNIDKKKYIIVLNHQPNDYQNEMLSQVDLVLSGHSHGGQLFPLGYISLLTKSNDSFYGMERRDKTTFIVNSGISDWSIDFKTGTRSEYGIIDIKKTSRK